MESTRAEDETSKLKILDMAWPAHPSATVIGITGAPGVGKSTFINQFGQYLLQNPKIKIAILSIDPSSQLTGGSILGDKTRMLELSQHPRCYIRPSSSQNSLGGVNPATAESILLLKAFGYDFILIESVGVGQSESELRDMCDWFWLLVAPGQGDDLQSLKRGILEMADMVLINKCDDEFLQQSQQTFLDYQLSMHLNQGEKNLSVLKISSYRSDGLDELKKNFTSMLSEQSTKEGKQLKAARRQMQLKRWFEKIVRLRAMQLLQEHLLDTKSLELGSDIPHRQAIALARKVILKHD
jgi:LAO/AO transport system kinase